MTVDLGEKKSQVCVLGADRHNHRAVAELVQLAPVAMVVMEAGSHSTWVSRLLNRPSHAAIVMERCVCQPARRGKH